MDDILAKLGLSTRTTVGVSVSANNRVEMICIDKMSRSITKYAARELRYNNAIREIIDYDEFAAVLIELFKELGLAPASCNVVLNLPNVHFSFIYLPLILADDQVNNAIISEVEQLYLFKRHEPVISWNSIDESKETDKRYVVYAALQDTVLENIKEVFSEVGAKIIAIENSHSAMLKGVQYSKIVDEEISNYEPFNIMLITSNSYAIFCMNGNKLVDYYEEPLAIKSFTDDEVYLAISSAAAGTLQDYPTRNLLLISETDEVSAELLSEKINFDGSIKYLDRNKYSDKTFMNIDFSILQTYIPMISLESVGTAAYSYEPYPIKFNFLSDVPDVVEPGNISITIFGKEIELERKALFTIVGSIVGGLILLFGLLIILLKVSTDKMTSSVDKLSMEQTQLEEQIKNSSVTSDAADIYTVSQQITSANKQAVSLYSALSTEIPPQVWIESFYTNADGEVIITGKSTASEHIYRFFKGLKMQNPDVFLAKLQLDYDATMPITATSSSDSLYSFEINSTKNKTKVTDDTNSDSSLNPQPAKTVPPGFLFFGGKQSKESPQDAEKSPTNIPMQAPGIPGSSPQLPTPIEPPTSSPAVPPITAAPH